nr:ATP-dependent DNA helicase RRM3-like [Tanacetum cinerariifolium]
NGSVYGAAAGEETTWQYLAEDVELRQWRIYKNPGLVLTDEQKKNFYLFQIELLLRSNNSSLRMFEGMPFPDDASILSSNNRLIHDELAYNTDELKEEHVQLKASMTGEQKKVYETIMSSAYNRSGRTFFLYGYDGTGKTFIWKTLAAAIRSRGEIVLNVASSGIASLLMSGGRTAHSRITVGGMTVVFGGDFRQILPVIPKGSRQDVVNASINRSYIFDNCIVLKLTTNMRLKSRGTPEEVLETKDFVEWILKVGNGTLSEPNDGEAIVDIPEEICIKEVADPIQAIVDFTFPNLMNNLDTRGYFQEKVVLAPTNEVFDTINDKLLENMPGDTVEYFSFESLCNSEPTSAISQAIFSPENINGMKFSVVPNHKLILKAIFSPKNINGMKFSVVPNHKLILKVGIPIMLLQNIDPSHGLCNGTRLQVLKMAPTVIQARIIGSTGPEGITLIPR